MEPVPDKQLLQRLEEAEPWHLRKDFRALLEVMVDISSILDLDKLLLEVAHHATDLSDGDAGMITLIDETGAFTKRYPYKLPDTVAKTKIPSNKGIFHEAIVKRASIIVNDYISYQEKTSGLVLAGVKSVLATPIMRKGKAIGVISIFNLSPGKYFTEYHARMLEMVTAQAAIAIDNAKLFEKIERSTEELEEGNKRLRTLLDVNLDIAAGLRLNELMQKIAINAVDLTSADVSAVGLVDKEKEVVTYPFIYNLPEIISKIDVPFESGMTGVVISQKRPLIVDDYQVFPQKIRIFAQAGLRSTAMIPLLSRDKIMGILWVSSINKEKKFSDSDVAILEGLARQASIALENVRLYESARTSAEELAHRAKELSVLNNLSNVLARTLELKTMLNAAVDSVMELFEADGAAIYLLDEKRQILNLAVIRGVTEEFIKKSMEIQPGSRLPGVITETGKPMIIENLADHPGLEIDVVNKAFVSMVGAPILAKGKVIGAFSLGSHKFGKFSQRDATLLESIGNELGVATENSRLYEAQRSISESLQRSMLPAYIPSIPHMEIGVKYSSATEEAIVGGDFYDIFDVDGKYAMVIGDVSGKGIEAASTTSMIKYVLRSYFYQIPSPAFALTQANKFVIREEEQAPFITVFCAVYDPETSTLTFSNAGHPFPCRLDQITKTCTILTTGNPAIGIIENYTYDEDTIVMNPGNFLVAYTDGVIEARSDGEFFGDERLVATLLEHINESPQKIADSIINATLEFSHGRLADDIALLVVRRVI